MEREFQKPGERDSSDGYPLFAVHDPPAVLPIARRRIDAGLPSLQGLLDECGAIELVLEEEQSERLRDGDTPEDCMTDLVPPGRLVGQAVAAGHAPGCGGWSAPGQPPE